MDGCAARKAPTGSALRAWSEAQLRRGQSPFLISWALEVLACADGVIRYVKALKERRLSFAVSQQDHSIWFGWWQDRRRFWADLLDCLDDEGGDVPRLRVQLRWLQLQFHRWTKLSAQERKLMLQQMSPENWQAGLAEGREFADEQKECALGEAYYGWSANDAETLDPSELAELALVFLLRVALPSFLEFGFSHDVVLRQAIKEQDHQALERVLRLDPLARSLPGVTERINDLMRSGRARQVALFEEAAIRPVTLSANDLRYGVKAMLMGWLIDWSKQVSPQFGRVFDLGDLTSLLDASAKDRGACADDDLPAGTDALRKKVRRSRHLMKAGYWDIFGVSNVPLR